jgi:RNA polymerase sigma factor (sigma-70 family)
MQQIQLGQGVSGSAISMLYQYYAPTLLTYLLLHTPTREDAEDILVEVFLAALERAQFNELSQEHQRLWLWRVAHNKVVDYYRFTKGRQFLSLDDVAETTFDDDYLAPEQVSIRGEDQADLHTHIQQLPVSHQQILRLRFVNDLRCTEIATLIGKSDGAVRMILSRALNYLRSIYGQY